MATETKHQCAKTVFSDRFGGRPCENNGKIERGNKWYCGTHDPIKVKERRAAQSAKWEAQWKRDREVREAHQREEDERDRRADAYPRLLEALEWVAGMYVPLTMPESSESQHSQALLIEARQRACEAIAKA